MRGRLFYVVGASGAGKDSLIQYARETLAEGAEVLFAHRYITRALKPGGENHVELSHGEFEVRERAGLFAMAWRSYGYRYGVGVEIDAWLSQGLVVVVNGSRGYIPVVRKRYPDIVIVWISADPKLVAARLEQRGRESRAEIEARVKRNAELGVKAPSGALHIDNDGAVEVAGRQLVELLQG